MRRALVVSSVGALAVLAFGPTLWSRFAADDFLLRYASIHATSLGSLLTSDPLAFQGGGNFFRPVWFAYDWVLTNISGDPALYHGMNVAIYAGVTVEVWLLLRKVVSAVPSGIAAAIFALYPRHTEAVAWYAGSMDLLPALFGLAAILLALQQWKRLPRLAAVAVMAGAAASSKENAYLLVLLFVLVQIVRGEPLRGASARRAYWEPAAAMVLGGLAAVVWRLDVFTKVGGYANHPWTPFRVVTAAGSDILAAASPPQLPMLIDLPLIAVPVGVLVVILVLGGRVTIVRPERRRVMLGGLAFAVVALLPTLNVAVNLNTSSDERFLFLPSVGLARRMVLSLGCPQGWIEPGHVPENRGRDVCRENRRRRQVPLSAQRRCSRSAHAGLRLRGRTIGAASRKRNVSHRPSRSRRASRAPRVLRRQERRRSALELDGDQGPVVTRASRRRRVPPPSPVGAESSPSASAPRGNARHSDRCSR